MNFPGFSHYISEIIRKYRVHIFVFFLVFFISLTFAHPAILLNDEFITANQVRQLHAGHQFVINEGKYGLGQNGTMSGYFYYRSNVLGYSIFLPLISMPAYWIIDITGEQIAYLILIFWTMTALILLLFINIFFKKYSYIVCWQWTQIAATVVFVLFFINLYYYSKFTIDGINSFPEVLAIGLTHMILLSLSGMLIYEICRTIFEDSAFSFFGTIVCLFSSSYFFWATYCKDHTLVLACFIPIVLFLVRFFKTDEYWYLPMAFIGCGLLAWARPEVALWMAIFVFGICGYTILRFRSQDHPGYSLLGVLCSPLFTFFGALPFFLNNYITTGNIFLPTQSLYLSDSNVTTVANASESLLPVGGVGSVQSVITMFTPSIPTSPIDTLKDLLGTLFFPATGNLGVFIIVPVFFVMTIIGVLLLLIKKIRFNSEEKTFIVLLSLTAGVVFFTYAHQIHSLNTDGGITPDIRYLSPLYFPLTLIGLIILKKIRLLPEDISETIRELGLLCIVGVPFSIISLCFAYTMNPSFINGNVPLGKFFTFYTAALIILSIIIILFNQSYCNYFRKFAIFLILLLYTVPFIWQVNATFVYFTFSGFAGHIFWIPIVRVFWEMTANIIFFR